MGGPWVRIKKIFQGQRYDVERALLLVGVIQERGIN